MIGAAAALEATRRQLAVQHTQETQLKAGLQAAEATLDLAHINLGYTRVTSPVDGMTGQRRVYPGQYVGVGTQVSAVVPLRHLYVIADYKETQLTHLHVGERAEIRIGSVSGCCAARARSVVVAGNWLPVCATAADNATGNFTKVVQRVPVKLKPDDEGGLGERLRPGMSVETTIHTEDPGSPAQ